MRALQILEASMELDVTGDIQQYVDPQKGNMVGLQKWEGSLHRLCSVQRSWGQGCVCKRRRFFPAVEQHKAPWEFELEAAE
jgi:hypothetical protein